MNERVPCPYTHGPEAMNDENRGWCRERIGRHCEGKDCRWKEAKVEPIDVVIKNIMQRKLF